MRTDGGIAGEACWLKLVFTLHKRGFTVKIPDPAWDLVLLACRVSLMIGVAVNRPYFRSFDLLYKGRMR